MKVRILHVLVQPVLVYDDGENLTPGPQAQPLAVPLSELAAMAETLADEVQQMNTAPDPT